MQLGDFQILPLVEQRFKLDGGSMFGVVPKKIWGRLVKADEANLVEMHTNLFVIKANGQNILCDTGLGDCLTEQERKIYAAFGKTGLETGLKEHGLAPDDIDYLFLSHLHTDHAGGAVKNDNGKLVTRFKNARYIMQKREWEDASSPNERTSAVYIKERLDVLEKSGQMELLNGNSDILPGVKAVLTGGHTPGHQGIEVSSDGKTAVYYADIMPFSYHARIPYVAAVDLNPLETMDVKRKLVKRLLDEDMVICFDHDTEIKIGRLTLDDKKVVVNKIE
jgi:glyoxylase-like metal-dependent hydrolase (beta-lactamase superfamily II)